jgi:preprotein translocase subunit SecB
MEEKQKSIRILSLLLVESQFKRQPHVNVDGKEKFEATIEVKGTVNPKENKIWSELTVVGNVKLENETQVESRIKMVGVFASANVSENEQLSFAKINGPAIVFPFIREHLDNLFVKAGLRPVRLNPVNFVELAQKADAEALAKSESSATSNPKQG